MDIKQTQLHQARYIKIIGYYLCLIGREASVRFYILHQRAEIVTLEKGKKRVRKYISIYIYIYIYIYIDIYIYITILTSNLTLIYEIPVLTESCRWLSNSSLTSSPISVNEAHSEILFKGFFLIHFMA